MYKGHMEKDNREGGLNVWGGGVGQWESNGVGVGGMGTTVIEQQFF